MMKKLKDFFKKKDKIEDWKRSLPLLYAGTFPTGEKIFTYRVEDLHKISYRHYANISEINAYLHSFGQTKSEWELAINRMEKDVLEAIDDPKKVPKTLVNISKYIDSFKSAVNGIRDTNTILEDEMLCMFYTLEGENELVYDEVANEKKKKLFKENPLLRAFFLSNLPKTSEFFKVISLTDMREILIQTRIMRDIYQSMTSSEIKT